jgi:amino acid adenylation domain-containing protein/non-ribosomal peptide synthase protein (TIGR01720 family)
MSLIKTSPYTKLFWVEYQLDPSRNDYNIVFDQTISGNLDIDRLKKALNHLVKDHLLLNSHLVADNEGELYWQENNSVNDLQLFDRGQNQKAFIEEPFDLENGSLYRFGLFELGENKYDVIMVLHHAVIDGNSVLEFIDLVSRYYNGYNETINLIDQKTQLANLNQSLLERVKYLKQYNNQSNFWEKSLAGMPAQNEFPKTKNFTKEKQSFGEFRFTIPKYKLGTDTAKKHRTTWFNIFSSIWALLIGRYSNSDSVYLTYPVGIGEASKFIYGGQINTAIFPVRYNSKTTFAELIKQSNEFVKSFKVNGLRYSHLPLTDILSNSDISKVDIGIAQTYLKDQNFKFSFNGCRSKMNYRYNNDIFGSELLLEYEENQDSFNFRLRYQESKYTPSFINQLEGYFRSLLLYGLQNPEKPLCDYCFLTDREYTKIIYKWNETDCEYPKDKTIIQLFEDQVEKTSDVIAVVFEDEQLTYRELNKKSNQLARYIRKNHKDRVGKALQSDTLIALCLDRSVEMILAILGVLKAGAAYVPMDANYPEDRIQYILEDTKARLLLTQSHLIERLSQTLFQGQLITQLIDLNQADYQQEDKTTLPIRSESTDLAYVIYTSGTTGKPKGALTAHKPLVNRLLWQQKAYDFNQRDKVLQKTPYIFDVSVWELLLPLISGSQLVFAKPEGHKDSHYLYQLITETGITKLHFVPSMLQAYIESLSEKDMEMNSLTDIFCSGEALPLKVAKQFKQFYPDIKLHNLYGPTEVAIDVSHYSDIKGTEELIPIGKPIQNIKFYILDPYKQPVPVGVIGELYVRGAGTARGYLKRRELTEEKFVPNPFATEEDKALGRTRLYKTGDLVRWLPDGNLEYISRNDFQVKIRGYRIELGEIESALLSYPDIKQVCVLAKERNGNQYLVSYSVSEEGQVIDSDKLIAHLQQVLPEYMVPSFFVSLDSFPLTVNGKLDRKALPDPEMTDVCQKSYVAPETKLQEGICNIWKEVLGLDIVGIEDDFFRIGGDSILSIQVSSRLRRANLNCTVKDIFTYRTVLKLAEYCLSLIDDCSEDILSEQGDLSGLAELLPIQRWFFEQKKAGYIQHINHWNQSFLIRVPELDINHLEKCIAVLVKYHDSLRFCYHKNTQTTQWSQKYQETPSLLDINKLDVSKLSSEIHLDEKLTEWQSEFDIEKGQLWRIGYLYGYSDDSARLHFAFHHLVIDTVSWRVLIEDIKTLYLSNNDFSNNDYLSQACKILGHKGSSYRQWSEFVRDYSKENTLEKNYWEKIISSIPDYRNQVQDHGDIYNQPELIEEVKLSLNTTRVLLQQANTAYHTEINDLLLTALAYTLKEWAGGDCHGVSLEGHGRENLNSSIDHSHTVGWYTSLYPVKLELSSGIGFSIKSIKENIRSIPNKGIGFGSFVLDEQNTLGFDQLPLICFNYLGQFGDKKIKDWQLTLESSGVSVSKNNMNRYLIHINGLVVNGQMTFYITSKLGESLTKCFAKNFLSYLDEVLHYCLEIISNQSEEYTSSDFMGLEISQTLLNKLQRKARDNNAIETIYLANSLQQGFIYHALSQGDADAYRVQLSFDYHQALDVDKYIQSWEMAIKCFPILRAAFNWEDGIYQIVYKEGLLNYQLHDISALKLESERNQRISSIQAVDRNINFDLTQPSLLRLHIIKQSEEHYTIIKTEHHSISDGWSSAILLQYVQTVYEQLKRNITLNIIPDKAYGLAQEYYISHENQVKQYWKRKLEEFNQINNLNPLLSCQVDLNKIRSLEQCADQRLKISGKLNHKLKQLVKLEGLTLNTLIQFAWHKLIQIYTQDQQTVVGTTISGRDIPIEGIEQSVGLYINTLPLMINWDNDKTIIEQANEIQQQIMLLNTYSYVNLTTLQRDGNRLFHSLLVFENYPLPEIVSNIDFKKNKPLQAEIRGTYEELDYPLGLIIYEAQGNLIMNLKYDKQLLDSSMAEVRLCQLELLLQQIVDVPEHPHRSLNAILAGEYNQTIYDWNQTDKDYPKEKTIHQLFQDQAEKTPNNIAIIFEKQELTYQTLNNRANQLARYIRRKYKEKTKMSLEPDASIVLYLDRSLEMIIAILAVLKAGGAYVPIDTKNPTERVEYRIKNSQARLILTQSHLVNDKALPESQIIEVDLILNKGPYQVEDTANLNSISRASNLAYIIYTSGTTGKPKGVMVEHSSIVNRIAHMVSYSDITSSDYYLFKTGYIFDVSISDIFTHLCTGAKLRITTESFDIKEITNYLLNENFTSLHLVPSQYDLIANILKQTSVSKIYFSGEAITSNILNDLNNVIRAYNYYGPTETGEITSFMPADKKESKLIGKVFQNHCAYVLDQFQQPVPVGVVGELHFSGVGLARGYLNHPDLTAERFVSNPFVTDSEKGYERLYKTGDLARWLSDGNLEYIGRNDFQVKIRGYRVELGEVENILSQHVDIHQACVLDKEKNDNKYLVGYYVSKQEGEIESDKLVNYLQQILPEYMIPSFFISLASFPLTVNGKIDRKALPDPDISALNRDKYIAPKNEIQTGICNIWSEILGLDKVGTEDDFFRIGGNSILAIKVAHAMSQHMGCQISINDVFKQRTIAHILSHDITTYVQTKITVCKNEKAVLSYSQERLWFIAQYDPGTSAYHIPMVYELIKIVDQIVLEKSLIFMVERHQILRTILHEEKGVYHQVVLNDQLNIMHKKCMTDIQFKDEINNDIKITFNLQIDYPIRVVFYDVYTNQDNPKTFILLNFHHIAFDGWSMDIFINELFLAYESFLHNKKPNLPVLTIQYKDYANWQREYLQDKKIQQQIQFWKSKLDGIEPLNLPTDYPRPNKINYCGSYLPFEIDEILSEKLRQIAKNKSCTMFSLLLSAFYILLHKYSYQKDITVGTPVANRHYSDVENLIGCFINSLALREQIDPNWTVGEFITRVMSQVVEAQANQDIPIEKLLDELNVNRDFSKQSLFQVIFSVQTFGHSDNKSSLFLDVDDIVDQTAAKFDIECHLDDSPLKIKGAFLYSNSLFKAETINRMLKHFIKILDLIGNDEMYHQISDINLLDSQEYNQIVYGWNGGNTSYPENKTIYELFELQVTKNPSGIAVVFDKQVITNKELDQKADQLARALINNTIERIGDQVDTSNQIIPICIQRDINMIIAHMAVLKAGFAFTPIDVNSPIERIKYIIEDVGSNLLLTSIQNVEELSSFGLDDVYLLTVESNFTEACSESYRLPVRYKANDLAYVIYTSGTTGLPKGVMVSHSNIISTASAVVQELSKLTDKEKIGQVCSNTFDTFCLDLTLSMIYEYELHVISESIRKDPYLLADYIEKQALTYIDMPTKLYESFSQEQLMACYSLKYLVVGGDRLASNIFKNNFVLVNAYGPTESTVESTLFINNTAINNGNIIGKHLSNEQTYILDEALKPVPIGVIGELYIGGAGLSKGYLNRSELTKERFISNQFATKADIEKGYTRLYKTGDLVRWLPDGNLEYIGRNDFQVKIRGYRIELAEIEKQLISIKGIKQACVVAKNRSTQNKSDNYLAAYYVLDKDIEVESIDGILDQWESVYDQEYDRFEASTEIYNDFSGWDSYETGLPIPVNEMELWRDNTVKRILELKPNTLLEVGVGNGLVMYPLLDHVKAFIGLDISKSIIHQHKQLLRNLDTPVSFYHLTADKLNQVPQDNIDCIVINSVCQYFPNIHYLENVIMQSVDKLSINGSLFIGDIRDYRFHKEHIENKLIFSQSTHSDSDISDISMKENELLVAPEYFINLASKFNHIKVDILEKAFDAINELSKYRYDVVIKHHDSSSMDINKITRINELDDYSGLKDNSILFENVNRGHLSKTSEELKNKLNNTCKANPDYLMKTYRYSSKGKEYISILLTKEEVYLSDIYKTTNVNTHKAFNIPYLNKLSKDEILFNLSKYLPEYSLPDALVEMETFPLTVNGKLDRNALPEPSFTSETDNYVAPTSELEIKFCVIWEEVLGAKGIGIKDNFFKVGGNSILAIQVANKMNAILEAKISVADIFKHKTIQDIETVVTANHHQIIIPVCKETKLPLSFAQERLWFIEQYEEGTNAYHIPLIAEFSENTDLTAFEQAVQYMIKRHQVLSTVIKVDDNGKAYQHICDKPLEILSYNIDSIEAFKIAVKQDINNIFELDKHYPIRVAIYLVSDSLSLKTHRKVFILVNIHHIAFDGWSMDIFLKELDISYLSFKANKAPILNELTIQYKDFAYWQKQFLTGDILEEQLNYWHNKLMGVEPLALPTDYPRPAKPDYKGRDITFEINIDTSRKLRDFAKSTGSTLYGVLLGGLYVLLNKYTGQEDIVIGTPIANRHYTQLENLIGFFVNTLAIRKQIPLNNTFRELILSLQNDLVEAQTHQDIPFEKLVESLKLEKDQSRHPIFQIMFSLQTFGKQHFQYLKPVDLGEDKYSPAQFDISLILSENGDQLQGILNYATSLFNTSTAEQLVGHYQSLLEKLVDAFDSPIKAILILSNQQYEQVIYQWNQTDSSYPKNKTIHQLFEGQVRKSPDRIALVFEDKQLTYRELNTRSNQLAKYIQTYYTNQSSRKIVPGSLICLCMNRSLEMIIGMLGVLKSGRAYVPIDPEYPDDRIEYILSDTKSALLLTESNLELDLSKLITKTNLITQTIALDNMIWVSEDQHNLFPHNCSTDLIYVIYTSGTTGKPKGVMVEHTSVTNLIFNQIREHNIKNEKILSVSPYVFDAFSEACFTSLLTGSQLYLFDFNKQNRNRLKQELCANEITHVDLTPSILSTIVPLTSTHIKRILCGAEILPRALVNEVSNNIAVINAYGPTETTVTSVQYTTKPSEQGSEGVQIGKPISNMKAYVLDQFQHPVPLGVLGELHIGGAGLARGYLNRPNLTAERFINNPFATELDIEKGYARLYKTGDLVKWLSDGNLEYIGRNDFQVKIRGYRIELGEIESLLSTYPNIKQICVLSKYRSSGATDSVNQAISSQNKYLVAYYVSESGKEIESDQLVSYLSQSLPDYMIPSFFVGLESFPLTINGKLDRKALPDPDISQLTQDTFIAPKTALQTEACMVWSEILGIEKIGIEDDFFRIGGNSILAIQLVYKLNELWLSNISVADIFRFKTIRQITEYIGSSGQESIIKTLSGSNILPVIYFIHPGHGGCEAYQQLAEQISSRYYSIGVDNYNILFDDKISHLKVLALLYIKHLKLTAHSDKKIILCGWSLGGHIALEMAVQLEQLGFKSIQIYLFDTILPDEKMRRLKIKIDDSTYQQNLCHYLQKLGHTKKYIEQILAAYEPEETLASQLPSRSLKYTQVNLFKATQIEDKNNLMGQYICSLMDNNIQKYCDKNIRLIRLDCHHWNILKSLGMNWL